MDYMNEYEKWLNDPYFDNDTRDELAALANDKEEIEDRFYKVLEFGTGGLRGVRGAGTNRMNISDGGQVIFQVVSQHRTGHDRGGCIALREG